MKKSISAICNYVATHSSKEMTIEKLTLVLNLLHMAQDTATSNYRKGVSCY